MYHCAPAFIQTQSWGSLHVSDLIILVGTFSVGNRDLPLQELVHGLLCQASCVLLVQLVEHPLHCLILLRHQTLDDVEELKWREVWMMEDLNR